MDRVSEFSKHEQACRDMAAKTSKPEHREMLLKMAETWRELAEGRTRQLHVRERVAAIEVDDGSKS